ncbi:Protein of unknown function [Caenispirillum bisanense]|uniref:DUF2937 family protein n=1 Tax=Caenispirillum bisanense TaxID=414052 RepID=A0A286GLT6_9PROT|nr:Protein of unknown function [Caenispirillum bisanense]
MVGWLGRKLDSAAGAVFGAVLGATASQGQAFTAAYVQRLGGRLDEAVMVLQQARDGALLPDVSTATRDQLVAEFAARVEHLSALRDALVDVAPLWRPFALLAQMDRTIAAATLGDFVPALPLTAATAVHAAVGLVLGLLLWELCKAPALLLRPRRRPAAKAARPRHAGRPQEAPPPRREPTLTATPTDRRE